MRKTGIFLCLLLFCISLSAEENKRNVSILWVGSSSSAPRLFNCVQKMLNTNPRVNVACRKSQGYARVDYIAQNRMGMKELKRAQTADFIFSKIKEAKADIVVLQISGGIFAQKEVLDKVPSVIDDFCETIKSSGAIPVLFEHWSSNSEVMREICIDAANRNNAVVAFCGSSSAEVTREKGLDYILNQVLRDKGHVGERGNYLWACSFYSALTGRSPVGIPVKTIERRSKVKQKNEQYTLSDEEADFLQKVAWNNYIKWKQKLEKKDAGL